MEVNFFLDDDERVIGGGSATLAFQHLHRQLVSTLTRRLEWKAADGKGLKFESEQGRKFESEQGRKFESEQGQKFESKQGQKFESKKSRKIESEKGRKFDSKKGQKVESEKDRKFDGEMSEMVSALELLPHMLEIVHTVQQGVS